MTKCNRPPEGWYCTRESGHEGPCAAWPDKPYDEYVNKVVRELPASAVERWPDINYVVLPFEDFRSLLADAWLSGLGYSLNLIETKEKRGPLSYRIHDAPKIFTGGTMIEPFYYEASDVHTT